MDAEEIVDGAGILLAQMAQDPDVLLAPLDRAERAAVAGTLRDLSAQAAAVQTDAELVKLADAVHRLIEDTPGLRSRLLEGAPTDVEAQREQRKGKLSDVAAAADQGQWFQDRAAQLKNTMDVCERHLHGPGQEPDQPKKKP